MSDDRKQKRLPPISYRPPKQLRAELYARQLRSGLSMNAFITQAIFDASAPRKRRPLSIDKGDLARVLNCAARIHDRLYEFAPDDNEAMDDLAVIRAALLKAMGRTP